MIDPSDDDTVVYEADVKFAPKRKGDFYLFQFSHNSSPFSIKKQCLGSIKAKPKSNQFEIELLMDTRSDTFDEDKGKRIAFNVDDSQQQKSYDEQHNEKFFPNNLMNKQVLNSEQLTSTNFQFAVGYLREDLDDVKLIPIKNVIEFKPAFRYMDKVKIRTSNKNQEDSDEDDEQELTSATKNQDQSTKKVTMRFEDDNDKRKKVIKNLDNDEPESWIDVKYFDYGISKFEREKEIVLYKTNQTISDESDDGVTLIDSKKFSYEEFASRNLNDLSNDIKKPIQSEGGEIKIDLLNTLPFYQTSSLPLKDQIRSILCSSKVISFNKCIYLLNLNIEKNRLSTQSTELSGLDLDLVLKYLQQYAQLVQGSWVVKSEIIYPKKNFNSSNSFDINSIPFTNISYDILYKARDFVLYKFTKQQSLSRLELIEQIRVPPDVITEVLVQFSNFNKQTRLWDFNLRDEDFLANYKEIVEKQETVWEATGKKLLSLFD